MLPLQQTQELQSAITEYLKATFTFRDTKLNESFHDFIKDEQEGLFKGPYVSLQLPFRKSPSNEGIPLEIKPNFNPFIHQSISFQRLTSQGQEPKPTLLTTGTGSGKTESFLYPIVDYCYKNRHRKGIKAIILYPMNALATDQAVRLAELIHKDEKRLRGTIRAGLFIGAGQGDGASLSKTMQKKRIIEDQESILSSVPDIILTNFKMLDYGLMRNKYHDLWYYNFEDPGLLKFLALDELHTYDGAQGTDVANLIRRLKLKLDIKKGSLCPIGTSATIGEGDDAAKLLTNYASKIFGEDFLLDSVVVEDRVTWQDFFGTSGDLIDFVPDLENIEKSLLQENDQFQDYVDKQIRLWEITDSSAVGVGRELKKLALFRDLFEVTNTEMLLPQDIISRLADKNKTFRSLPEWDEKLKHSPRYSVFESLLALVSFAKDVVLINDGEDDFKTPLVYLRVQSWIRELSGIMRYLNDEPTFTWRDSKKENQGEDEKASLPMYFCRECGASGWLTKKNDNHNKFESDPGDIFKDYFSHQKNVYFLNTDRESHKPVTEAAMTTILTESVSTSTLQFTREKDEETIKVIAARKINDRGKSEHVCTECAATNTVSIVGTRMATLASIAVSQSLSSNLDVQQDGDRKILAFSNGVQDAAHQAGFIEARNYRFMFRTSLQQLLREMGDGVKLSEVIKEFKPYWLKKLKTSAQFCFRFYPDDCAKKAPIEFYLNKGKETFSSEFERELDHRISWEIISEFGYNSLIGRTLQKTGNSTVYVDTEKYSTLYESLRTWMKENMMESVDSDAFHKFVAGLLFRFRTRGGIDHRYLKKYRSESLKLWALNWTKDSRHFLNRRFHQQSRFPRLITTKYHPEGLLDTTYTKQRNWFHAWFSKSFELVKDNTDLINDFYEELLEALTHVEIVSQGNSNGIVNYAINPEVFQVSLNVQFKQCDSCSHRISIAAQDVDLLSSKCQQYRCSGKYVKDVETTYNYYNKVYSRSHAPRVMSHEHTGILERDVRERVENSFKSGDEDRSLNALVATSTLEMGIDIGNLDSAYNLGIPPLPANYLQRIGRAGRKSGSSLVANFVATSNPHDMYFLRAPFEMMAGKIHTPGCFLNAPEILKRQLFAHFLDIWVKEDHVKNTIPNLLLHIKIESSDLRSDEFFINKVYTWIKKNHKGLFVKVMEAYEPELNEQLLEVVSYDIENGNFGDWLLNPFTDLKNKLLKINQQRQDIVEYIKDQKLGKMDEERILLEQEKKALYRTSRKIKGDQVLEYMTMSGLLPNYAFPDKGVELTGRVFVPTPPGSDILSEVISKSYVRPASSALRELAPHNTFFAEGYKYLIEGLATYSWGGKDSELETFRFCSNCDHIDLAAGTDHKRCPKCGDESFGAASNKHSYALMSGAKSDVVRERAALDDSSDDRDPVVYKVIRHLKFPEKSTGSLALVDIPFGIEFTPSVEIMETNVGKTESAHSDRVQIAQQENIPKHGFVTCRHCGFSTNTPVFEQDSSQRKKTPFHFPYCKHKTIKYEGKSNETFEEVYLYRTQKTEALKILLPTQDFESDEYRQIFKAGIEIGLKEFYQGNPSHLAFLNYQEFNHDTGKFDQYIVLYDRVPGGTGYISELYDKKVFTSILESAYEKIKTCSCQLEGKDGCYHCVYSYRNKFISDALSRSKAEEEFENLLKNATNWKELDHSLSDVTKDGQIEESELEEKFIFTLKSWCKYKKWKFDRRIVNNAVNYFIQLPIGDVSKISGALLTYQIKPQVRLGKTDGLSISQRCDFLMIPVEINNGSKDDIHNFSKVIVELDGYKYHASNKNQRLLNDLEKRRSIISNPEYSFWVLTWDDVDKMHDYLESEKRSQDIFNDELSIYQPQFSNSLRAVRTLPLAKEFDSAKEMMHNSFERFLTMLALESTKRHSLFGLTSLYSTMQFPNPHMSRAGAEEYISKRLEFQEPPASQNQPSGDSYVRSDLSTDNSLFQARICTTLTTGASIASIELKEAAKGEIDKNEWQYFWRLTNMLQYAKELNINSHYENDQHKLDSPKDESDSKTAIIENYDESVRDVVAFCIQNGIEIDPDGGYSLFSDGKEVAGADLAVVSKKIVFHPFGEVETKEFIKRGFEIAEAKTFVLKRLL